MENPLLLLTAEILEALLQAGYRFFVLQSYPQGMVAGAKDSLLLSPYRDIAEANAHFQHIQFDRRKYIYQTHHPEEVERLRKAAGQPEGYRVYIAILAPHQKAPRKELLPIIKQYVRTKTKWRSGDGHISAEIILQYGVLSVLLSGPDGSEKVVSLEDLLKL
ncbi:hypothetical protein [Chitinophaga varians]|uniref:hypothetical protein n=1 Tax=Chitinophaga varians TaxID=2202339 RepID=UPI00165FAA11|nr:hypothetical protein [Chitinophaga varians]MBC9913202.1 hypothetical protein [Chitinophaga varians]